MEVAVDGTVKAREWKPDRTQHLLGSPADDSKESRNVQDIFHEGMVIPR